MENEQVFAAEAEVDSAFKPKASQKSPRYEHLGEDAATATQGGIDGRTPAYFSNYEERPLLEGQGLDGGDDGEDDQGQPWSGTGDFAGLPWWKQPSIFWMLPPFLLVALAFGGIIVPKLNLILQLICQEYIADRSLKDPNFTMMPVIFGEDNPQCRIPEVQSRVAQFTLYGNLFSGLLSAVTSPKLGALSDRLGRRKIIVVTTLGMLLSEVITICAATYTETFNVNWILIGYAIDGLSGSFIVAMAMTHSYATDCTPPARRNVAFGYFHGCLFTGIAIGPLIAGYVIKATDSVLSVFYIALAAHISFILFLALVVPESLSKARQQAARDKYRIERERLGTATDWLSQWRLTFNLLEPLKILYPTGPGSSPVVRRNLILLSAVDTIMFGVAMGSMTVVVIYTNYQFGWGNFESSIFVSIVNSCRVTCLIVLLPLITRLLRGPSSRRDQKNTGSDLFDLSVIRLAVFFDTLGYLGYTLARSGSIFIASGAVAAIGGMGSPTLQSALTKHVPPDKTGQLLGASGLLHALARVVAPTIFNAIYSVTVKSYTQTVFVCLTATFGMAFIVSWFVRPHVYLEEPEENTEVQD